jgi:hypothetical protein
MYTPGRMGSLKKITIWPVIDDSLEMFTEAGEA